MENLSDIELRELEEDIKEIRDHITALTESLGKLLDKRAKLNERAIDIAFGSSYEREIDEDLRGLD